MNLQRQRSEDEVDVTINLVSFIDVLLCLVIFFMVSTTFVSKARIPMDLPQASANPEPSREAEKVEVAISATGKTFVNANLVGPGGLRHALAEAANHDKKVNLVISADRQSTHQSVIDVLDAARQVGLAQVSFVTNTQADSP